MIYYTDIKVRLVLEVSKQKEKHMKIGVNKTILKIMDAMVLPNLLTHTEQFHISSLAARVSCKNTIW